MQKNIRVLIVDDSALVREALSDILSTDASIQVMGTAADPYIAVNKIRAEVPDVIILDVEMPRMDGITFLGRIMSQHPIPVIICSSHVGIGNDVTFKALELGAVDVLQKPRLDTPEVLEESRIHLCDAVKAASTARVSLLGRYREVSPKLTADAVLRKGSAKPLLGSTDKVVVVGASTGGTEALRIFLQGLPADAPGVVIVQHMPEHFTTSFARRLDQICAVSVKEAANNDTVLQGRVLIAPGNRHTLLKRSGSRYFVEVTDGPLVSRHRPSVDVLFRSAARYAGGNAVAVIMTGMGDDGANGMLELKESGSRTIAQDEASSVVFGMPHEAIKKGCVDKVLPIGRIAAEVLQLCSE